MSAISAIPDTIPILHAAPGCAGNAIWAQNGACGLQVGGFCSGLSAPSTNVQEREVVFGGIERLREIIKNALNIIDGKLYYVITGCVPEIIGDDVGSIVGEFRENGVEIIFANTGGFHGNSYKGYDLTLTGLFSQYVKKGVNKKSNAINLWGIPPFLDPFWRGNIQGVRNILERLGFEVNSFFTVDDSLEEIRNSACAELNIVVSDIYGIDAATFFENEFKTPFIKTNLPVGPSATTDFIRTLRSNIDISLEKINKLIEVENNRYYKYVETLTDCYTDMDLQRYAIVIGDANYAPAITKFLSDDLGWLPEVSVITDTLTDEQKSTVRTRYSSLKSGFSPLIVFETDGTEIISHVRKRIGSSNGMKYQDIQGPIFVIGSSQDRELAATLGAQHLSLSFPVANRAILDRGYTGFSGGLRLTEDLLSTIVAGR